MSDTANVKPVIPWHPTYDQIKTIKLTPGSLFWRNGQRSNGNPIRVSTLQMRFPWRSWMGWFSTSMVIHIDVIDYTNGSIHTQGYTAGTLPNFVQQMELKGLDVSITADWRLPFIGDFLSMDQVPSCVYTTAKGPLVNVCDD